MTFNNEREFENHLRREFFIPVLKGNSEFELFENKKAVDILICKNGRRPALFFIEVKYHRKSNGRLGFGHAKGNGFQPEILSKNPKYFQSNMRWIHGIENTTGYLFLNNNEIVKYLNGGGVGIKYNGIKPSIFRDQRLLNKSELKREIKNWLKID